ncbi:MAG: domain often clustered or fused with uracil-DNA glycosylase [Flaviaesturariibacter sp.]|nr:domain often clustered or fused with uracil-DNA glycosylase [Flaviaesturariibacter sp.]
MAAVFDVYDYRFTDVSVCPADRFNGHLFSEPHRVYTDEKKAKRVAAGLLNKISEDASAQLYRCFLSGDAAIEETLLAYIRYALSSGPSVESDFSHPAVIKVTQIAKKVWREQHRMEAFVRFQKTADGLFYAIIEPDHDVLPLIAKHFKNRYADQRWLIYDARRRYGLSHEDGGVSFIEVSFAEGSTSARDVAHVYDASEDLYQKLWKQYMTSVNIAARKNLRLQVQHMPRRYWKYMPEIGG